MVYDHRVKHNGIVYEAGQEVPNGTPVTAKSETVVVEVEQEKTEEKPKATPKKTTKTRK